MGNSEFRIRNSELLSARPIINLRIAVPGPQACSREFKIQNSKLKIYLGLGQESGTSLRYDGDNESVPNCRSHSPSNQFAVPIRDR